MKRKLLPSDYNALVFVDGNIPLCDVFPGGISVAIDGDNIELLTPPDSRYKIIDGVVVRVDDAPLDSRLPGK